MSADLDIGGPRGDLADDRVLTEDQAGLLLRLDKVLLECLLQQLDGEAVGILEVTEVADLLELVWRRDRSSLLDDLLSREVDVCQTDSDLPVATVPRTSVLLTPRWGFLIPHDCRGD